MKTWLPAPATLGVRFGTLPRDLLRNRSLLAFLGQKRRSRLLGACSWRSLMVLVAPLPPKFHPVRGTAFPPANPTRQPFALLRFWLPRRRNSGSGPDPLWIFSPGLDSLQRSGASSFGSVATSASRFRHLRVGFQRLGLLVTSLRSGSSVAPRLTLGGAWSGALPRAKSTPLEICDFCEDPDVYGDPTYAQTSRLVRLNSSVGRKPSGIPSSLGKLRLSLALRNSTTGSDLESRGCRWTFQSSYPLRAQSNPSGRVRQ